MDEKDYLILQCLSEEQNLTRVAERLYITQPALTYRLRRMEREFDAPVIARQGKGIGLTPEGEYLVRYARKMTADLKNVKDEIANMQGGVHGHIRIGVSSYFGLHNLPSILQRFSAQYPKAHFNVTTGWSEEIYELLINDDIHVGVVRGDFPWFDQKHLLNEERICVISRSPIHLGELPRLPRISYKPPILSNRLVSYAHSSLAQAIDRWWYERFHEPPTITMQVDSFETCKEMVKHVCGYAIIPSDFIHDGDGLYKEDLVHKNGEPILRATWMYYRESTLKYALLDKFIADMKRVE
ncbi:LysR family transcriptional regulator [Alicyclobacillus fastidiosus]|uniref:LysR family transcriptional regulator n=1 Tax=Alicyclobacillus fastidiosus TaxID=392011 RepID=A0ABV5AGA0_9BACL|nr:LysR family transcriptional regulator [Alicyclobacillus fastidiosus]WEH08926.1 LysR family transcriptional regulator [Alicyclobacillus fastidiosus]